LILEARKSSKKIKKKHVAKEKKIYACKKMEKNKYREKSITPKKMQENESRLKKPITL